MSVDFVLCTRNVSSGKFGNEPGASKFLVVPENAQPAPDQNQSRKAWADAIVAEAKSWGQDVDGNDGHILFFIHGFNNNQALVMERHRKLKQDLRARGFRGVVVSYDWPSADLGINYLEDRLDAKRTALQLVSDGIALFVRFQTPGCRVATHILAHSMGALVAREAFDDADDRRTIAEANWTISQVLFIAGDISSGSLEAGNSTSDSLYRHCIRLTNYSSRHDATLGLSNVKRLGVAPRVGRHGLPDETPDKAINVDCSDYWETIPASQPVIGDRKHSWHIGDPVFMQDLLATMQGIDRQSMPTRDGANNRFQLKKPA